MNSFTRELRQVTAGAARLTTLTTKNHFFFGRPIRVHASCMHELSQAPMRIVGWTEVAPAPVRALHSKPKADD